MSKREWKLFVEEYFNSREIYDLGGGEPPTL